MGFLILILLKEKLTDNRSLKPFKIFQRNSFGFESIEETCFRI